MMIKCTTHYFMTYIHILYCVTSTHTRARAHTHTPTHPDTHAHAHPTQRNATANFIINICEAVFPAQPGDAIAATYQAPHAPALTVFDQYLTSI